VHCAMRGAEKSPNFGQVSRTSAGFLNLGAAVSSKDVRLAQGCAKI
jgi:hypothetical protein